MRQYIKDNKIHYVPITIKDNGQIIITNDEEIILDHGFEIYTPPVIETVETPIDITTLRFNKRKVKNLLVNVGLWDDVKSSLTEDEYQDLILSEDFAFDDELFVRTYENIKKIVEEDPQTLSGLLTGYLSGLPSGDTVDDLLLMCVKDI